MFESLAPVDWSELELEKVPNWLVSLVSLSLDIRANARNNLEEYVIRINQPQYDNQLRLSELLQNDAPLLIIPYLLELISLEETPDKAKILDMLIALACYAKMKDSENQFADKIARMQSLIYSQSQIFEKLLKSVDSGIRASAFSLIARQQNLKPSSIGLLSQVIELESNVQTRIFMKTMLAAVS